MAGEASYLAQKTVIGYCRVKTMYDYEKLLTEPDFRDAHDICRWEGFASTLGDIVILVEGWLRPPESAPRRRLAAALQDLHDSILDQQVPPHRQDWADRREAFGRRFALACLAQPPAPDHVVEESAKLIHELVPIHMRLKRNDREVILGDLRLHALAMHESMQKRFRRDDLVAVLTG